MGLFGGWNFKMYKDKEHMPKISRTFMPSRRAMGQGLDPDAMKHPGLRGQSLRKRYSGNRLGGR